MDEEVAVLAKAAELFNRKLYFECHDVLEDAWAGSRGEQRAFLQGLIHLAVGLYHVAAGNDAGAVSQLERGIERLAPFRPQRAGLDVEGLVRGAERCLDKARRRLAGESVVWTAEDVPRMNPAV